MEPLVIDSQRLRLRPLESADALAIVAHLADPAVSRNLRMVPHPYGLADAEAFLAHAVAAWASGSERARAVTSRADGRLLGVCSLSFGGRVAPDADEIGYWLGRAHWGQGLGSELVRALADAHLAAGGRPLVAPVVPANAASRRVLEKAGFRAAGTHLEAMPHLGGTQALALYRRDV